MTDTNDLKTHDPHLAAQLARRQQTGDTMTDQNENNNGNQPQAPLPEAPASMTAKVIDRNGFDVLLTVRDYSMQALFKKWNKFSNQLVELGYAPTNAPRQATPPQAPPEQTPADIEREINPERAAASQQPQEAAAPAPAAGGHDAIIAERLIGSVSKGKVYWKIIGGKYQEHGISIWPEVLQPALVEGLIPGLQGDLDPRCEYSLSGWVAHYSLNKNNNPAKVTMFTQTA